MARRISRNGGAAELVRGKVQNQVGESRDGPLPVHAVVGFEPFVLDRNDRVLHILGHLVQIFPDLLDTLQPLALHIFPRFGIFHHHDAGLMGTDLFQIRDPGRTIKFRHHIYGEDTSDDAARNRADENDGQQAFGYGGHDFQGHFHRGLFHPCRFFGHPVIRLLTLKWVASSCRKISVPIL